VKTTVYSEAELASLCTWASTIEEVVDLKAKESLSGYYETEGYLRHLSSSATWRVRKAISQALRGAETLGDVRLERFGRCVVLRTAQWALDGRKEMPSINAFRGKLSDFAIEMLAGSTELAKAVGDSGKTARCICGSTADLQASAVGDGRPPRLVLTSPPYPGVHVLYHRWQIQGGKETPAPFWIANRLDGDGAAYYTMGDRKSHALGKYFLELRRSLDAVAAICDEHTIGVQVVAFSEPKWQLPRYLSVVDDAGFEELFLSKDGESLPEPRLWRKVPNRKWYASQRGDTGGSQEVVLFHRLRGACSS
jgi:hypothetical protein